MNRERSTASLALAANQRKKEKAYWLNQLSDRPQKTSFPFDHDPGDGPVPYRLETLEFSLDENICRQLTVLSKGTDERLFIVLLTGVFILLKKYSGSSDILLGIPVSRPRDKSALLNHTLTIRNTLRDTVTFRQLLTEIRRVVIAAVNHQNFPIEILADLLEMTRTPGEGFPLLDVVVSLKNIHHDTAHELSPNILISFDRDSRGIGGRFSYNAGRYSRAAIERLAAHFQALLEGVLADPGIQISAIELLSEKEKQEILVSFNDTDADFPGATAVHELVDRQAGLTPGAKAVIYRDQQLTYEELEKKTGKAAAVLKKKGIEADTITAVLFDHSPGMVVTLLAILKAGGAYLPIDPGIPAARIQYLIEDSGVKYIIAADRYLDKIRDHRDRVLPYSRLIEDSSSVGPLTGAGKTHQPHHLAYIMYTSGSTGKPKGVMIRHISFIEFITWAVDVFEHRPGYRVLLSNSYASDGSIQQIYPPLVSGGTLHLVDKELRLDAARYLEYLKENKINNIDEVPVLMNELVGHLEMAGREGVLPDLTNLCLGSEYVPIELVRKCRKYLNRGGKIINAYGPAEASVETTFYYFDGTSDSEISLIGKPRSNTRVYIRDQAGNCCPIGVKGEISISGTGLARGYLNHPELTAEKFISNRSYKSYGSYISERLYKTGDQGCWQPDGNIRFFGRMDNQIQVRGYRVELSGIQQVLKSHDRVKDAVVLARENKRGETQICAYYIGPAAGSRMRRYLEDRLPSYMLPSHLIELEKIPLTPNGKVDTGALPDPGTISATADIEYIAPRSAIEKKLVEVWEDVLLRTNIGIYENFFTIGGDSIKSILIISKMNRVGYKLETRDLFRYPTIADLALKVRKVEQYSDQAPVTGTVPLTPIQERFFASPMKKFHHYNQAVMLYSKSGLSEDAVKSIFTGIQRHHDALRMSYKRENGRVVQINHGPGYPFSLREYDLKNIENSREVLEDKVNDIQAGIDLEKGPLMKLGLFHMDDGDRLLIVIHHLVIDGVSWRILFEDIDTLHRQYKEEQQMVLPPKTASFKTWGEKLVQYADSASFLKEKPYWKQMETAEVPFIQKDFPGGDNKIKDANSISFQLSKEETLQLLTVVNEAYGTEINDILLTALGLAVKKTFGHDRLLIVLEGHGREELFNDVDIMRTVGWFTTEYPVLLETLYDDDPGRQVKEIKERLRRLPNKGIGYGILRYITSPQQKKEIDFKLNPQVSFNYLGQFDADVEQSSFQIGAWAGHLQDPEEQREYEIDISGMITGNRLVKTITYSQKQFKTGTIETLLHHFKTRLGDIIAHCSSREQREFTPSDYTYKGLSIQQLDGLKSQYQIEDLYIMTPMQEGMLFHALHDDSPDTYFEQISYSIQGRLDITLVEKSLNELFKRHDILRTAFVYEDIEPFIQVVLKDRKVGFYYEDIRYIKEPGKKEAFIEEFKERDRQRRFDLSKDVLLRVSVLETGESRYVITWSFHHILMDGWCIAILNTEFFEIYNSYLENRPHRLGAVKPYRNYCQWLQEVDKEVSKQYWQNSLASFAEQTGIPKMERTGGHVKGYKNERVSHLYDKEKTAGLNRLAARNNVTLNTVLRAVWGILLGKYNNKEDIVYGSVVSGRPSHIEGVESMVGLFINTIPVRTGFAGKTKFKDLLQHVQEQAIAGEPYHYHPLAEIQAESLLKQDLFDHIFVFENFPVEEQIRETQGENPQSNNNFSLKLSGVEVFEQTNYDFNLIFLPGVQLSVRVGYNGNIYHGSFVEGVIRHLNRIFDQVIAEEALEIQDIELLSRQEKDRLLLEFNNTGSKYPGHETIHGLFVRQVEKNPERVAIAGMGIQPLQVDGTRLSRVMCLSYRELDNKSGQLAGTLKQKGLKPGAIAAIMLDRSVDMIIAILGVLKAGGAYLPIDPGYPPDRIDYMLKDSSAGVLVTERRDINYQLSIVNEITPKSRRLNNPPKEANSINNYQLTINNLQLERTDLAYIIYTSGSTGNPKGVLVEHRSLVNLCFWHNRYYAVKETDHTTQYASICFDASVWEIFPYLIKGAAIHIVNDSIKLDMEKLNQYYEKHHITISFLPTQISEAFMKLENRSLRALLTGGDRLRTFYRNNYRLYNNYGPTENTVVTTSYLVETGENNIPVGKPVDNHRVYILNRNSFNLQPMGVTGELCIAGHGLARGYLNNPELTAEKFCLRRPGGRFLKKLPPWTPRKNFSLRVPRVDFYRSYRSHRSYIYLTGDLARWLPDGNIEILGRADHQVKIRGFRIELGEIETQLLKHNEIKQGIVIARTGKNGDKYLCAYTYSENPIPVSKLKTFLLKRLPGYMVPSFFVELGEIPLTSSGKIDRNALPDPETDGLDGKEEIIAPRDEIEKKLVEIWEKVLDKTNIGINENFFMVGGDSIKAIQIVSKMNKQGYKIETKDIFDSPIISDLALKVKPLERVPEQAPVMGKIPLTAIQEKFFMDFPIDPHHFNQAVMLYSKTGFNEKAIKEVFTKIQEHHDALRMTYKREKGEIVQYNHGLDYPLSIQVYDFKNKKDIEKTLESVINETQGSIDLEKGPLMKVALFHLDDGDHLLIAVHHLVIDGVSWRILFEDMEILYRQYLAGKQMALPLKTDSFKIWAEKVCRYADSPAFLKEKSYWEKLESMEIPGIQEDFKEEDNYIMDTGTLSFDMDEKETRQLLTEANRAFGTEINDILLTALGLALKKVYGNNRLLIALEGHGREELFKDVNINRTVGWFTSVYPVSLDISHENDPGRQIKEIKESFRKVPNKGIGYGILKYITAGKYKENINFKLNPQVSFNYLGQFDADIAQMTSFRMSPIPTGNSQSKKAKRMFQFDISGMINDNRLTMFLSYSKKQYKRETIETILACYKEELGELISFCSAREDREASPSDFAYKGLSIDQFDGLFQ
jgi:amino acid adenylation domain-containing protein/non-ribosomal peptide synthase protein (TIGR01720 family)